jgi:multisubunit Na+/H+ antiporter MnhC subunit
MTELGGGAPNPYEAPNYEPLGPRRELSGYRPATTLTTVLSVMLVLNGVMAVLGAWATVGELELLGTWPEMDPDAAEASDARLRAIFLTSAVINLPTIVVFAMFLHRANANARALSDVELEFTPGWTVGWFFVPFANLFKPYQAVREIWWRSDPGEPARPGFPSSGPLPLWWALWLGWIVLNRIATKLATDTTNDSAIESFVFASQLSTTADGVRIALCAMALVVVRRIYARQQQKAAIVAAERAAG